MNSKTPGSGTTPASHHIAVIALHDAGEAMRDARVLRYHVVFLWVIVVALTLRVCL
jgi:hypothetical protein